MYRARTSHTFSSSTLEDQTFTTAHAAWLAIAQDYASTDAGLSPENQREASEQMAERTDPGEYFTPEGERLSVEPDQLCVVITRVRYLESDVFEGDHPRDDCRIETVECGGWAEAARTLRDNGCTEWSSYPPEWNGGNGWFASPHGSVAVDHGTGAQEEVTAHLIGPGAFRAWFETVSRTAEFNMYRRSPDPVLGGYIADGWDGGDPYGSAMGALGAIADVLFALDPNAIPAKWEFRPAYGASQDLEAMAIHRNEAGELTGAEDLLTAELAADALSGAITERDLVRAGNILSRFIDILPEDRKY